MLAFIFIVKIILWVMLGLRFAGLLYTGYKSEETPIYAVKKYYQNAAGKNARVIVFCTAAIIALYALGL